jgi:phage terminase Nu1 subunit (DNA packaging protein)
MTNQLLIEQSQLITRKSLAKLLNVTVQTLANWRSKGMGPPYLKLTDGQRGHVRYCLADVVAWEQSLARHSQKVVKEDDADPGVLVSGEELDAQ